MKKLFTSILLAAFLLSGCAELSKDYRIGSPANPKICIDVFNIRNLQYLDYVDINVVTKTMEYDILAALKAQGLDLSTMNVRSVNVEFSYVDIIDCNILHIEKRSVYGGVSGKLTLPYIDPSYFSWFVEYTYR